jgi:hypothetical protein
MKILLRGTELFHAEYRWTDKTLIIIALRNITNAPKSVRNENFLPHRSS